MHRPGKSTPVKPDVQTFRKAAEVDHALYDYSALPWRATAGDTGVLHAFVVLALEYWELCPPSDAIRDPRMVGEFGSFFPDYRAWSQREYGLRVGVFRVLDALQAAGIQPVVAANALVLPRLPRLVTYLRDMGCNWIAHGIAATQIMHSGMTQAHQEHAIAQSIAAIEHATGRRPLGWLGQDWGSTPQTFELLARAGMGYTLDWCNDDQPYWLKTQPPLLAIPLSAEWDDVQSQWLRQLEPRAWATLALEAFERLCLECASQRRDAVFGLCLHPWLSGMPSRIQALRDLLLTLRRNPGVRWCNLEDVFQDARRKEAHGLS